MNHVQNDKINTEITFCSIILGHFLYFSLFVNATLILPCGNTLLKILSSPLLNMVFK
jgi:hypothetical protein